MNRKAVEKFSAWLTARGAEVLVNTNPYEVIRFRAGSTVSIVYRNKSGDNTFTNEAAAAYEAFQKNGAWTAGVRKAARIWQRSITVRSIIQRDGDECFYCGLVLTPETETVEHLLARAHGGSNHLSNLVLAHNSCNFGAGHLSVIEKIKRREAALPRFDLINDLKSGTYQKQTGEK